MRRALAAAIAALLVTVLAACAGLPTGGQVYPGLSPVDTESDPEIRFVPDRPQAGASAQDIVSGFLRAGSGPQDNWETARLFLTSDFANEWDPRASVTIDRLGDRSEPSEPLEGVSTVEISPTGLVDAEGAYAPQSGGSVTLTFTVVEEDGEWRISSAPDGVVLFEEVFRSVFRDVTVAWFDPSWQYLVPDVRWFPRTANIATYVVDALVDGAPSPWLAGGVVSAFPDDVVAAGSVPLADGVAQVELSSSALTLGQTALDRMQAQLEASLRSADVNDAQMTVNGSPLDARAAATRSTRVDSESLVELQDGRFGFLEGDDVERVSDLSAAVESVQALAVEAAPGLDAAAVLTPAGAVRALADGTTALVDERPGVLAPSIDPFGVIWSVPAGNPAAVRAALPGGETVEVTDAWPAAVAIRAMQVSRDGARVAALVVVRGHTELWIAAVRRSSDGLALALGEPQTLAVLSGEGIDVAWLNDATVGVLESLGGDSTLREQPVGGPGTDITIPAGIVTLVGGNSSARLLSASGALHVRQGTNWPQIATDVRVLAAQQGMP